MPHREKPYVLLVAELIYLEISKIKKSNPDFSIVNAVETFIGTEAYKKISSGKFHDDLINKLTKNKFIDNKTKKKLPNETIGLIKIQNISVNRAIKLVKMGKVKLANQIIKKAINYLIKKKCKKIILGCTELPIAIFAFKSFKTIKQSKIFLDPNLILANAAKKKYQKS